MEKIMQLLWMTSWQVAIIGALVWGISRLASKAPAAWRHALWIIVLIKLFVPPFAVFPSNLAFWQKPVTAVSVAPSTNHAQSQIKTMQPNTVNPDKQQIKASVPANPSSAVRSTPVQIGITNRMNILVLIWCFGVCAMILIIMVRIMTQIRLLRKSTPASADLIELLVDGATTLAVRKLPEIRLSDSVNVPMLVGTIRPVILLPHKIMSVCSMDELKAMLLHELGHVKRRDLAVMWLHQLAQSLFFFHPIVWIAGREMKRERELACDELVLLKSAINPKDYAAGYMSALKMANGANSFATSLGMAEPFDIEKKRLHMILHKSIKALSWKWIAVLLLITAAFLPTFIRYSHRESAAVHVYNDQQRAFEILREAWNIKGQLTWYRVFAPARMAARNPNLALKIAQSPDGSVPEEVIAQVILDLLKSDSEKALKLAPEYVEKISNPHLKVRLWGELGLAAADTDLKLAGKYYARAKEYARRGGPIPELQTAGGDDTDYALLAGLAGKLNNYNEANSWIYKLLKLAKKDRHGDEILQVRVGLVAKGDPNLALSLVLVPQIIKDLPKMSALSRIIGETSLYNGKRAQKILAFLDTPYGNGSGSAVYGEGALYVIVANGKTDPDGMLEIARNIKDDRYRPLALCLSAAFFPDDEALVILQEAFDSVRVSANFVLEDLGWIANQAYLRDPETGRRLFKQAQKQIGLVKKQHPGFEAAIASDIARLAYYMEIYDPSGSQSMLEDLLSDAKHGRYQDSSWVLVEIAEAMAPLDLDRALEIVKMIPESDDPAKRVYALDRIARIVLETDQERERRDYLHSGRSGMWIFAGPMPR